MKDYRFDFRNLSDKSISWRHWKNSLDFLGGFNPAVSVGGVGVTPYVMKSEELGETSLVL